MKALEELVCQSADAQEGVNARPHAQAAVTLGWLELRLTARQGARMWGILENICKVPLFSEQTG